MRKLICRSTLMLALLPAAAFAQDAATATASASTTEMAAPAADAMPAAPTDEAVSFNPLIGAPPAGKGLIVFFRPSKMVGAAMGIKITEGETELGKLRNGKYLVLETAPGAHVFGDDLNLEVEAGETYYVQASMSMGVMSGRKNLAPSDQATFDGLAGKLKKDN